MSTLAADRQRIEAFLLENLSNQFVIDSAMTHALLAGGKRVRAHLVYSSMRLFGGDLHIADFGAAAIESMHAYSLVHDDLPAMDDDDFRRGLPTIHKKWNDAIAILTGDALQSFSFEILSKTPVSADRTISLVTSLAKASGARGMVLGQMLDLDSEGKQITLDELIFLQSRKTGDLISWAAAFGARATGNDDEALLQYGDALGRAFQIKDDILDVEASSEVLGKTSGKDNEADKVTYVSAFGLAGAKKEAQKAYEESIEALHMFDEYADDLRDLASFVITREN